MSSTPLARAVVRATLALSILVMLICALTPSAASSQDRHVVYLPALHKPGQPPTPTPPTPTPDLSPLSISVAFDAERAVSAPVGAEGGQLSATGADGTVYTLSIPAGALAYTQTLTLAPSASVAGLPLSGGALGAAQIAPEGLILMQPATLTIAPPELPEAATIYAFGFDDTGAEFHLRGSDDAAAQLAGTKTISIRAPKLRGYGAGKGTQADVAQYRGKHRPSRIADRIVEDGLIVLLPTYEEWVEEKREEMGDILALLKQAGKQPEAIEEAVLAYIEWDYRVGRHPQKDTDLGPERAAFRERLRQAIKTASAGAAERCYSKHNLADGLRLQRWLYYLYTYAKPTDSRYLEAMVMKCLSFDLEVQASFVRNGNPGGTNIRIDVGVESRIRLKPVLNYPLFGLVGQGELTVKRAIYNSQVECSERFIPKTTHPMRVINVTIVPDGSNGYNVDSILFDPGKGIQGTVFWTCDSGDGDKAYDLLYTAEFSMIHQDELHGGTNSGIFRLPHWQPSGGDQIATTGKTYQRSKDLPDAVGTIWRVEEDTTFILRHRP